MRIVASLLIATALLPVSAVGAAPSGDVDTIAIRTVTLTGQKRLLSAHDLPSHYTLSPDLTRFAYVPSGSDGGAKREIRVSNVRPLPERVLVEAGSPIADVAWAPNGSSIAFSLVDSIWLVRPDGTDLRRIADLGGSLTWSPDSRELALQHPIGRAPVTISILTLDSGAIRDVATGVDPSWSPDGRSLLYTAPDEVRGGYTVVRIVRVAGGEPRTIARGEAGAWAPGGKRVTFTRALGREPSSLWVVPAIGGKAKLLAHWANESIWSPNGRRIAFLKTRWTVRLCTRRYRTTLGVVPSGGGKVHVVTRTREAVDLLAWSRGGSRVLYLSYVCPPG